MRAREKECECECLCERDGPIDGGGNEEGAFNRCIPSHLPLVADEAMLTHYVFQAGGGKKTHTKDVPTALPQGFATSGGSADDPYGWGGGGGRGEEKIWDWGGLGG